MIFEILLIEDNESEIDVCKTTIERINDEEGRELYGLVVAQSINEAEELLREREFQGVIIDIKLKGEENGNTVIHHIMEKYRVPVIVFTGTPDVDLPENSPIPVYKKAEKEYEEILSELVSINRTGLFNVIGGRGLIEQEITKIFWNNLYPRKQIWEKYAEEGKEIEKILLRYTLAHLLEGADEGGPAYCTEEMYINPVACTDIKTGSIVKVKDEEIYRIVLSPPCDVAIHNGNMKTDRILLCEIEKKEIMDDIISRAMKKAKNEEEKVVLKNDICLRLLINRYADYYHWLPDNELFVGGFVNFRKLNTYTQKEIKNMYMQTGIKVQDIFVKNILNRLSTYYARQGQPDFEFCKEVENRM